MANSLRASAQLPPFVPPPFDPCSIFLSIGIGKGGGASAGAYTCLLMMLISMMPLGVCHNTDADRMSCTHMAGVRPRQVWWARGDVTQSIHIYIYMTCMM